MDRLAELEWLLATTRESIEQSDPERRAPLIAQMRALTEDIEAAGGGEARPVERNGLIDFQEALAERKQPAAKGSRRSSR